MRPCTVITSTLCLVPRTITTTGRSFQHHPQQPQQPQQPQLRHQQPQLPGRQQKLLAVKQQQLPALQVHLQQAI